MKRLIFLLILILVLTLVITPAETVEADTSGQFDTHITGRVVMRSTGQPMANLEVWLAEVVCPNDYCVYILDTMRSPGTYTDESGYWNITNIKPTRYVIVFGKIPPDPVANLHTYQIVTQGDGRAKAWKVDVGVILDTGTLNTRLLPGGGSNFETFTPMLWSYGE